MCVCVSVSDREMSSKLENEMRGTPCHTHARTLTHSLSYSPRLFGGELFVSNLANWTEKPAVCF